MDNLKVQIIELASTLALRTVHSYMESVSIAQAVICEGYIKQRYGKWKPQMQDFNYYDTLECSICGKVIDISEGDYKFCPNCGASMKGGAE